MPVNLEWNVRHELLSPAGSILINRPGQILANGIDRALYQLKPNPYEIVPPRFRQVTDDLSQGDGTSVQPPYISGLVASLYLEFWVLKGGNRAASEPACADQLREMEQALTLNLNALRTQGATPDGTQRLLWKPTGYADRQMLTQVLLSGWPTPQWIGDDGRGAGVAFQLATPFPYAVDETTVDIAITDGGAAVLVPNGGNADYSPVINVAGPTSAFAITRVDTGEVVSYIGPDAIPGGQHAEIDFFTANIAVGATDLIADLDPTVTTFFTIPPGGCELEITGADCTVLSRAAVL